MAEDLSQQIADAAKGPSSVTQDGGTTTARSISDLIAADRHLAAKAAAKRRNGGVRRQRISPPGSLGD